MNRVKAGTALQDGRAHSLLPGVYEVGAVSVKSDDVFGDAVRGQVQHPEEGGTNGLLEVICFATKHDAVKS